MMGEKERTVRTFSASSSPRRMSFRTTLASRGAIALLNYEGKRNCKISSTMACSRFYPASLPPCLPPSHGSISHRILDRRKKPGVLSSLISRARASGVHSARTGKPRTL